MITVPRIASKVISLERMNYSFADAPVEKLTIGNFAFMLKDRSVQRELSNVCVFDLNKTSYDESWWKAHKETIYQIATLRNECCHSGNTFDSIKLHELIKDIFELRTIGEVQLYAAISNRV